MRRQIQIKRVGAACKGYKVLVGKDRPARRDGRGKYDVWIPELAPKYDLEWRYRKGNVSWKEFCELYRRYLYSIEAQDLIKPFALLSLRRNLVLLCDCRNSTRCFAKLLAQCIEECRAKRDFVVNMPAGRRMQGQSPGHSGPRTIIDFLKEDHDRLLKDRVDIEQNLSKGSFLKGKINRYASDLKLHEAIEHKFLIAQLKLLPVGGNLSHLLNGYEREHRKIWCLLNNISNLKNDHFAKLKRSFFDFFAFVEAHVLTEERVLFPAIENLLEKSILAAMGKKAESYHRRFKNRIMAQAHQNAAKAKRWE